MAKTLAVVVSGAPADQQLREISIDPGTRVIDVLNGLNLRGYVLSREGSNQILAEEEDLYPQVESGTKLRAAPVAAVGAVIGEREMVLL
jgi:hypothetical protein